MAGAFVVAGAVVAARVVVAAVGRGVAEVVAGRGAAVVAGRVVVAGGACVVAGAWVVGWTVVGATVAGWTVVGAAVAVAGVGAAAAAVAGTDANWRGASVAGAAAPHPVSSTALATTDMVRRRFMARPRLAGVRPTLVARKS